jgi:competence protein CoiA
MAPAHSLGDLYAALAKSVVQFHAAFASPKHTINVMLTSVRKADLVKVVAHETTKTEGPFACPKCGSETILHKGFIRVAHFAHKPPVSCEYGTGESERHRQCKQEIYTQLSSYRNISCELEKDLGKVVPDIFIDCGAGNPKIAIEVQISSLTMERIIERTREYNRLNVHVLWLPLYTEALKQERYAPKAWERWLHATYYGRVYYWMEGLSVAVFHFDQYQLYVEATDWFENGEQHSAGGYYRKSKRYRTPRPGPIVHITNDFTLNQRKAWSGSEMVVPECKLFVDTHRPWW